MKACILTPYSRGFIVPCAHVAQLVEHIHGKDEVTSSILVMGSRVLYRKKDMRAAMRVGTEAVKRDRL